MTMVENSGPITPPPVVHRAAPANGATVALAEKVSVRGLNFYYGDNRALKDVNVPLYAGLVTAFIGPSGCGKSTLLRVLNRIYDLYPNQRADGQVLLDNQDVLNPGQDLNLLRARVGMVFQKPTPFPMSIYENIAFGIRLYERLSKGEMDGRVESALRRAALWDEVKDKLSANGLSRCKAGGDPVGRAVLGPGSHCNCQN
jgi:phosphate transport system ATP-binding protein